MSSRSLGSLLRKARGDRGVAQWATLLGVTRATVYRIEAGAHVPSFTIVQRAVALSGGIVSAEELMDATPKQ